MIDLILNNITLLIGVVSTFVCGFIYYKSSSTNVIKLPEQRKPLPGFERFLMLFTLGTNASMLVNINSELTTSTNVLVSTFINNFFVWTTAALFGLLYMNQYKNKLLSYITKLSYIFLGIISMQSINDILVSYFGFELNPVINLIVYGFIVVIVFINIEYNYTVYMSKICFVVLITLLITNSIYNVEYQTLNWDFNKESLLNLPVIGLTKKFALSLLIGRFLAYCSNGLTIRKYLVKTIISPTAIVMLISYLLYTLGFRLDTSIQNSVLGMLTVVCGGLLQITSMDIVGKTLVKDTNGYMSKKDSKKELVFSLLVILASSVFITEHRYGKLAFIVISLPIIGFILVRSIMNIKHIKDIPNGEPEDK